ncbi:MAG: polysaccharide pyruvyl transferase family protein [Oscillospiraceae bacterium]|nr:polysaccharide pyruvyl transferase family protein [Oscillospiraceae bacterium]
MNKEILLRSAWQDVNIGDIAHTPGLLAILEKRLPEVKVTVWASVNITVEVMNLICRRFPGVRIVRGNLDSGEVRAAVSRADLFLHGSGACLCGKWELKQYLEVTGGSFGVWGITYRKQDKEWLDQADFLYFRDGVSLLNAQSDGVCAKHMDFGPDAAFAADIADEGRANRFLSDNQLNNKEFVCCVPRLRITPYWTIRGDAPYNQAADELNGRNKERDHRHLRTAVTRILDQTDFKVLVCPEDQTQIAVGREMIIEKLPEKYRTRVVHRQNFWLADEAVSVYKKSLALFGNEMHSPIMCVGNHVPAIVSRWEQQTSKGYMWNDIGLNEWLFDCDAGIDGNRFADTVLDVIKNNAAAVKKTERAMNTVNRAYDRMAKHVRALIHR